jgi:acetoin utilization protein AcuB
MSKPIPTIQKYMTTCPETIAPETTLAAATRIMSERKFRHLPVVRDGDLVGMVSDRDLKLAASFHEIDMAIMPVADLMVADVFSCDPEARLDEVCATMAANKVGSAVILQNGKVVGIFTTVDALHALATLLQTRLAK